jgi:hypothetical protein
VSVRLYPYANVSESRLRILMQRSASPVVISNAVTGMWLSIRIHPLGACRIGRMSTAPIMGTSVSLFHRDLGGWLAYALTGLGVSACGVAKPPADDAIDQDPHLRRGGFELASLRDAVKLPRSIVVKH